MIKKQYTDWIKDHLEEMFTAVLTAFFTALMFRVGMGMLFSIIVGLVLAYVVRLVLIRKAVESFRRKAAARRQDSDP